MISQLPYSDKLPHTFFFSLSLFFSFLVSHNGKSPETMRPRCLSRWSVGDWCSPRVVGGAWLCAEKLALSFLISIRVPETPQGSLCGENGRMKVMTRHFDRFNIFSRALRNGEVRPPAETPGASKVFLCSKCPVPEEISISGSSCTWWDLWVTDRIGGIYTMKLIQLLMTDRKVIKLLFQILSFFHKQLVTNYFCSKQKSLFFPLPLPCLF